ncbi:MAG TPA: hypothetical protein VMC07_01455 [Candidatus Omnitrophota bacterium]|nr:hypothetical protein [Candidatus Omnitrophota bacterium]
MSKERKKGIFLFGNKIVNRYGQVWIETVIYTLIAIVIIGLVLAFVQPKVLELSDKATVQQSLSMMSEIDNVIQTLSQSGTGNTRKIEINLKSGSLEIDGINDQIVLTMERSHYQLSEPDTPVNYGSIKVYTHAVNDLNTINMTLAYPQYNLTYGKADAIQTITQSSTPYNLFVTNNGGSKINLDFVLG